MKQNKRHTALYQFLHPFLESGADAETLTKARKEYAKAYKAKWQREHRKANKRYTITFNKSEQRIIDAVALTHHRKPAVFIKEASLAYCNKKFLSLDENTVNAIKELLTMNYCFLQQIGEDYEIESSKLLNITASLEKKILEALTNPIEIK